MNDLFKKLNVLIRASVNDAVNDTVPRLKSRPGKAGEGEVATLRRRVNEAVEFEDEIKARIQQNADEADRWDRQADDAVAQGDDASARYAIEQMKRAQQRTQMARADLREHQRVTQELIERVNMLDAAVADSHAAQAPAPTETAPIPDLTNVLREARDKIASLGDAAAAQRDPDPPARAAVEDDLEQRRQRLSKR